MLLKANWAAVVHNKNRPPYTPYSIFIYNFQSEWHSLLMFKFYVEGLDKGVIVVWVDWMNGVWITYISSFLPLTFLFCPSNSLPSYISLLTPFSAAARRIIYCLGNNIWVFMSAFALEWVRWTFACIFVLLNVSHDCRCLWVCANMCFVHVWKSKSEWARASFHQGFFCCCFFPPHIYAFVRLHVCVCSVGLYSNRRA